MSARPRSSRNLTTLLALAILAAAARPCRAIETWVRTYGTPIYDGSGSDLVVLDDGSFALAGSAWSVGAGLADVLLLKLDPRGEITWQRAWGGPDWDDPATVVATSDGGYLLAGSTKSFGRGERDVWVLKVDAFGVDQWQKTSGESFVDMAWDAVESTDGTFVVAGFTQDVSDVSDAQAWILTLNPDGQAQRERTYGGPGWEEARSIVQTSDGGYAFAGSTESFGAVGEDGWIVKLDTRDGIEWEKRYGGPEREYFLSLAPTSDGGFVAAGGTYPGGGQPDAWVMRLDGTGEVLWQERLGGLDHDLALAAAELDDGSVLVSGITHSMGAGFQDAWLIRLDPFGAVLWQKTYGGGNQEGATAPASTPDGGIAIGGFTDSFGAGLGDLWLLKLDEAGNVGTDCGLQRATSVGPVATTVVPVATTLVRGHPAGNPSRTDAVPVTGLSSSIVECAADCPLAVVPPEVSPPGAPAQLRFRTKTLLAWEDVAAGGPCVVYNLYRGFVARLPARDHGACVQSGLTLPEAIDAQRPVAGLPLCYLVTAESPAGEGPMGTDSSGTPRANASPCR